MLIGDIAKAKSHVNQLKQFTNSMKTDFDMWDDKTSIDDMIKSCPKWDPENSALQEGQDCRTQADRSPEAGQEHAVY